MAGAESSTPRLGAYRGCRGRRGVADSAPATHHPRSTLDESGSYSHPLLCANESIPWPMSWHDTVLRSRRAWRRIVPDPAGSSRLVDIRLVNGLHDRAHERRRDPWPRDRDGDRVVLGGTRCGASRRVDMGILDGH